MDKLAVLGTSLAACLTLKNIIFCVVAGIVIGVVTGFIKDEITGKVHSMLAFIIIGILFAYLGLAWIAGRYTLFSIQAILAGVAGAVIGELTVGSAIPGRG